MRQNWRGGFYFYFSSFYYWKLLFAMPHVKPA